MRHEALFGNVETLLEPEKLVGRIVDVAAVTGKLVVAAQERHTHVEIIRPYSHVVECVHHIAPIEGSVLKAILLVGDMIAPPDPL